MAYTIRPASALDAAFVYEMLYEALCVSPGGKPFPRSILDEPDIAHYAARFGTHTGDLGFVAETSDEKIGAAWVRLLTGNDRGYGHVGDDTPEISVAVRSDQQNRGSGTALIERLVETLPRVRLSVDSRNPASRLHERLGFETVATDQTSLAMLQQT